MDPVDLNDAYIVRSLDDLAKLYAKPLPKIANKETDHITSGFRKTLKSLKTKDLLFTLS